MPLGGHRRTRRSADSVFAALSQCKNSFLLMHYINDYVTLSTFTNFLQRIDRGKAEFWQKHGQNYVAKVHLEMEKTDDHAQRYNLKRRLEEVLGDRRELAIWTNLMLKEGGYA